MYYILYKVLPSIASIFIGLYLWLHFRKLPFIVCFGKKKKMLPGLLAVVLVELCVIASKNVWKIGAVIVLFLAFSFLFTDVVNLILKKLWMAEKKKGNGFFKWQFQEKMPEGIWKGKIFGKVHHVWKRIYCGGIFPLCLTLAILGYSYHNMRNIRYKDYVIQTEKEGMEEGLSITMISDVHLGTTMDISDFRKWCQEIEDGKPDLLVVAGDLFDESTDKGEMEEACVVLGEIKSRYGTYYVYGNHDMGTHGGNPYFGKKEIRDNMKQAGVILLDDKTELIDGRFYIAGRKDAGTAQKKKRETTEELLSGLDKKRFVLMIDHQPYLLQEEADEGVDLQLSGHTHGGQIWPVGFLSELFGLHEMNYGYRRIGDYQIIVSSGMGGWSYPLRIGSHSEIVRIQIKGSYDNH